MAIVNRTVLSIVAVCILLSVWQGAGESQTRNGVGGIVGLQAGQVTINWGSNDGVKAGVHFVAFRQNQMVHPQTGEYLSLERDIIGNIEITRVTPTYSVGRFVSTRMPPQVGDLVELVIDEREQYPYDSNQPEPGTITNRNGNSITFNIGAKQNVEDGLYFDVLRGGQKIGAAVVTRVSEGSSMASLTGGAQAVQIGDRVELAEEQQADRTVTGMANANQGAPAPAPNMPAQRTGTEMRSPATTMAAEPRLLGTITGINGSTIRFDWLNRGMQAPQGILAGIYRQEQLIHPVTGENLGAPLILIGQIRLDRAERKSGSGTIISFEASPRNGDKVGYIERSASANSDVLPAQRIPERPRWESGSMMTRQASGLNQDVQNLQRELAYLRNLSNRITTMERSIAAQQKSTQSVQGQLRAIKKRLDELTGGVVPQEARLIGPQSGTEVFGSGTDKSQEYTFRVTPDFKVKLQMEDKTVLVSLDKDSLHIEEAREAPAPEPVAMNEDMHDTASSMAETPSVTEHEARHEGESVDLNELLTPGTEAEQPFYIKNWKMIAGGVGGLLLLFLAFSLLKGKKGGGKKSSSRKKDFAEEEPEEEAGGEEEPAGEDEEFEEEEIEGI